MPWTVEVNGKAAKTITHMDKPIRNRIMGYLKQLEALDNPRTQGKALTGKYSGLWRYRVGDYRLISQIKDKEIIILILDIDHRKDIYR
jgi:mRNA interferase RelE/StbE